MEIADWVFDSVLDFIKSPLWKGPIDDFIEKHCEVFKGASEAEENKLEWTVLHRKFQDLIENQLTTYLAELDVNPQQFVEAIKTGKNEELAELILHYLKALDDFECFARMMEKKNHEMELETLCECAKFAQMAREAKERGELIGGNASGAFVIIGPGAHDPDNVNHRGGANNNNGGRPDLTEEEGMREMERFLFAFALGGGFNAMMIAHKEAEAIDAQLLQALAMTIALEQERLMLIALKAELEGLHAEQLAQELEAEAQANIAEATAKTQELREENARKIAVEEVQEKEMAKAEEEHKKQQPEQQPPPQQEADEKERRETYAAALKAQEIEQKKAQAGGELPKVVSPPKLAPVGERRGGFGSAAPLPGISPGKAPSFEELKRQATERMEAERQQQALPSAAASSSSSASASQPTQEEMAKRAEYLKAQRERLLALKQQKRANEIQSMKENVLGQNNQQQQPQSNNDDTPSKQGQGGTFANVDEATQRELRLALQRRFREDILAETRAAAKREQEAQQ